METPTHNLLKRLSAAWLRSRGYFAAACEVRSPMARWVLDVAGWRDSWFDGVTGERIRLDQPQTAIVECKCSRADFLRDSRRFDALLTLRGRYEGIRRSIEEYRIKALEPQLRRSGSSLFAELEEWDFASSALPAYQRTLRKLEQIDQRLHGQTKFFHIARYALADALYLATPAGLLTQRELPGGWGLLEWSGPPDPPGSPNAGDGLSVRVEAQPTTSRPAHRHRLLRNIAIAACAATARQRDAIIVETDVDPAVAPEQSGVSSRQSSARSPAADR